MSAIESFTYTSNVEQTVSYDGIIAVSCPWGQYFYTGSITINGIIVAYSGYTNGYSGWQMTANVNKGDKIIIYGGTQAFARFYKNRDYSNR